MTILEICEPLFQYVCRLNRMARLGGNADYAVVRGEIKALLEDIAQKGKSDFKLGAQLKKLELPLLFFVDSLIATSRLRCAGQWHQNRLAYELKEKAGDEKFFDVLEESLNDTSEEASERLAFFYACLGLGFAGMYAGQPDHLRKYMNNIFPRIRHMVDYDRTARICEDAYKSVDTRSFIQPPGNSILFVLVLFIFLSLSVLVAYYAMYWNASNVLRSSLEQVATHKLPAK